jgi:hypothetical protein
MSSHSSVATTLSARARASRINGAKSRGPRTAAGRARSSRNALRHGLCARTHLLLPDERAADFAAFAAALIAELAPEGPLQAVLAERVAVAAWRLARADRLEAEALAFRMRTDGTSGLALIRDGNGTRAVETLLRYRGAALAELLRCQRTLQALQPGTRAGSDRPAPSPAPRRRARPRPEDMPPRRAPTANPAVASQDRIADRSLAARPAPPPATAPKMKPALVATAAPRTDLPAADRSRPGDPDRVLPDAGLAAHLSVLAETKQTRES